MMDIPDNRALRFIARMQCDWWLPYQAIINRLFEDGFIDDDEFVRTLAMFDKRPEDFGFYMDTEKDGDLKDLTWIAGSMIKRL